MRIKDKAQFALGVYNILLAITGIIIIIVQHRIRKLPLLVICFAWGILAFLMASKRKRRDKNVKQNCRQWLKCMGGIRKVI